MSDQEITTNAVHNQSWEQIPNYLDPSKPLDQQINWNPTKPDVADPDNEYIAQKIMGLTPCDGWHYVNFGSAGGAALMSDTRCTHNGKCYPSMTTGNMHGKVGGCPEYKTNMNAFRELLAFLRQDAKTIILQFDGYGDNDGAVVATIRDIDARTNMVACAGTMQEALALAAIKFHKYQESRNAPTPTFLQEHPIPVESVVTKGLVCPHCGTQDSCSPGTQCGNCGGWCPESETGS